MLMTVREKSFSLFLFLLVANVKANDSRTQKTQHFFSSSQLRSKLKLKTFLSPPAAIRRAAVNRCASAREPLFMSAHVQDAA